MRFNSRSIFYYLKLNSFRIYLVELVRRTLRVPNQTSLIKQRVLSTVIEEYGKQVAYGPFKGMKLNEDVWWGRFDQTAKILGEYEKEVCQKLITILDRKNPIFIDIGAADGYYAVGVAYTNLASHVHAFEISDDGKNKLMFNAAINNCTDKVSVYGEATFNSLKQIIDKHIDSVVMIDIEGVEYELLTKEILEMMSKCTIIVELHPYLVENGFNKEVQLLERAKKLFTVSKIYRKSYEPNKFKVLNLLSDDERLLAFSESRPKNPKWLVLDPHSNSQN